MAVLFSWLAGLPVGILSALKRNSPLDYGVRLLVTLMMAIPGFWLALTFIMITVLFFAWRPPLEISYLWTDPWENLQLTFGPALALGVGLAAVIARMSRATLLEVLREDYVRTARSKGLRESMVVWRHALRNALLPVVTVSGVQLGAIMGGTVAVERAFSVPGLGFTLIFGIQERDWMVIQNLVLVFAVVRVMLNLAVDVSYGWLDPRIRYQ